MIFEYIFEYISWQFDAVLDCRKGASLGSDSVPVPVWPVCLSTTRGDGSFLGAQMEKRGERSSERS